MWNMVGQQGYAQNGCGCCSGGSPTGAMGGYSPLGANNGMSDIGSMNAMMMNMMMTSMMGLMTQLMQMLVGGTGLAGGGQFGASPGGSPVGDFLGGASSGGGTPSGSGGAVGSSGSSGDGASSAGFPTGTVNPGSVNPSSVKDKTSTSGLSPEAIAGLNEAHKFGLPLVSGKRSGSGTSDHNHGDAIDVGTLPIGAASSTGGTKEMKEFAEYMRQQGKAGKLNVKYVIADGKIASSKDNWAWRPYTYPGKTQAQLEALKKSNRGEYNRIQHYDHVHVSFQ